MAGDRSMEEMEKDLEELFESHPVAAARESGVHTTEEGKATSVTDALLQKILVGDEPVKVDVSKLLSATWRMQVDDLRTVVTTAIVSRLQTLEQFDKLRRAYDENQELLTKSQEELAECKAKYIALEKVVHANNSTLTMSMSSLSSTAWTPAKIKLELPTSAERMTLAGTAEDTKEDRDAPQQDISGRRTTLAPGDQEVFDRNFQSCQETQQILAELTGGVS
jgi:hypothetical protein